MTDVALIYNKKSGDEYGGKTLTSLFKQYDINILDRFSIDEISSKKLEKLITKGTIIAAVGGDGTLNAVARVLVGTKSVLLPLPGGTFNHFVRDIGMPANIETILENLASAEIRTIDVGYVNDELFLNNSNLGLYPFSLIERKTLKKVLGKWIAAVVSAFDQLSVFRRHRLTIDDKSVKSPFVFVGNGIYDIQSSLIPARTNLTKNTLTVMMSSASTRRRLFAGLWAVIKGDVSQVDHFDVSHRTAIDIYSQRATLSVSLDGEAKRLSTPLRYRVAAKALNVMIVTIDDSAVR